MIVGFGVGALAAPVGVSALMDATTAAAFPATMGVIGLTTALFVMIRMAANPVEIEEERTPYQALPRTTPVAYALDPWSAGEETSEEATDDIADSEAEEPGWREAWFSPENEADLDEPEAPASDDAAPENPDKDGAPD